MTYRILIVSGGTGGHVYPIVPIVGALKNRAIQNGKELDIQILGDGKLLEQVAVQLSLPMYRLLSAKARRYISILNIIDFFKVPFIVLQALFRVWLFMPDLVFIKGSGSSLIVGLVAKLLFIPIMIHESDAIPALTNRILGKLASRIFVSFEESKKYFSAEKTVLVGNPIRPEIVSGSRADALTSFQFNDQKPIVLIVGGSQGASAINKIVIESLVQLTKDFQIIHQTGEGDYKNIQKLIEQVEKEGQQTYGQIIRANYRVYAFFDSAQQSAAYAAADVIVARAGAGTLFEIAALGKPAIIIPLPNSGSDHQVANANEIAKFGAIVILQDNLSSHILIKEIQTAYAQRESISTNIRQFAKLDAADMIANNIL